MAKVIKQEKPTPPKDMSEALGTIQKQGEEINRLAHATQLPVKGNEKNAGDNWGQSPIQIKSQFAKTGYLGVDEFSYRERRQRYFQRRRALDDLYTIAFNVSDIRTCVLNLRNEIFRRGVAFVPKFVKKCTNDNCEQEFQEDVKVCPTCNTITRDPNPGQLKRISVHFKEVNKFGQSFVDVCKEAEDDVQIVDDGFILLAKTYKMDEYGMIQMARVDSIERLDPIFTEFDLDTNGYPEQNTFFCLKHRDFVGRQGGTCAQEETENGETKPCGLHLVPAMYKVRYRGKMLYYTRDEVIHYSKYSPSKTYGYSPIFSVYEKALTLIGMDRFLYDYFYERQLPVGILGIISENAEALEEKRREWTMELEQNPHYIPIMAIESQTGHGRVEWVKLGYTLQELDYLPIRDEIRQRVSALYGVTSVFQGAPQDVRGAQTTEVQLVVQARVIESAQTIYNEKVFPRFMDAYGITDYLCHVITPEEQSEENAWRVKNSKANYAATLVQMGFTAKLTPKGEFVFSGEGKRPGEPGQLMSPEQTEGAGTEPGSGDQGMEEPNEEQPPNGEQKPNPGETGTEGSEGEQSISPGGGQTGYGMQSMLLSKAETGRPYGAVKLGDQLNTIVFKGFNTKVSELAQKIKPWMTKEQAIVEVRKAIEEWRKYADEDSRAVLKMLMQTGIEAGMREGGWNPTPTRNEAVVKYLAEHPSGFIPSLMTFSDDAKKEFEKIVSSAFTTAPADLNKMTYDMKRFVEEDAEWRVRTIARTELAKLSGEGKILAWTQDPEREQYDYWWLSKQDARTKPISTVFAQGGPYDFRTIMSMWRDPTKRTAENLQIRNAETIPNSTTSDIYNQRCSIVRTPKM